MTRGVCIGIDPGDVRIGVAVSDAEGILATPVTTLTDREHAAEGIAALATQQHAVRIFVGLPLNLSGRWTASTHKAFALAREIAAYTDIPVLMLDERFTTSTASGVLRATGRGTRKGRSVIDQIAAVTLLQHALDTEHSSGRASGVPLVQIDEPPHD